MTAFLHWTVGAEQAEAFWSAGGRPEPQAGNRTQRRAAARSTPRPASAAGAAAFGALKIGAEVLTAPIPIPVGGVSLGVFPGIAFLGLLSSPRPVLPEALAAAGVRLRGARRPVAASICPAPRGGGCVSMVRRYWGTKRWNTDDQLYVELELLPQRPVIDPPGVSKSTFAAELTEWVDRPVWV